MDIHKKITILKTYNSTLKEKKKKELIYNETPEETLTRIYNEFTKKYNKNINETLNFTDPVEISQAFIYAYKNGFLSKDLSFSYTTKQAEIINYLWLMGATVLTGKGCCRHTSQLLADIYNDYGFNSTTIETGINQYKININFEELSTSTLDFIKTLDISNITEEELISILSNNGIPMNGQWIYDRKKVPSNHSITGVSHNGFAYYIDPTNNNYYKMNNGRLVDKTGNVENTIKLPLFAASDPIHDKKKIKELIKLPSIDLELVKSICTKTNLLCKNNYDLFEQFYKENNETYEEITETLKKI